MTLFVACYSRGNIHDTYPTTEEWCIKDRSLPVGPTGDQNIVHRGFPTETAAQEWLDSHPDFTVENHGTIFLLRPHTDAAKLWVEEHLPDTAPILGDAVAVEHRYIADIVEGITADGLRAK